MLVGRLHHWIVEDKMNNEIELDFETLAEKINLKIKEAAEAMKEARKLANDAGVDALNLDEYGNGEDSELFEYINISPLFNELDEAGWRTSSIGC
jgi:hypothetical protein